MRKADGDGNTLPFEKLERKPRRKSKVGRPAGPDPVGKYRVSIPAGLHDLVMKRALAEGKTLSGVIAECLKAWAQK